MFAVPGWAVSADSLKAETAADSAGKSPQESELASSKKRKRSSVSASVTSSNVADLWEKVIEGRPDKKAKAEQQNQVAASKKGLLKDGTPRLTLKEKKKLKKQREKEAAGESEDRGTSVVTKSEPVAEGSGPALVKEGKKKGKKERRSESRLDKDGNAREEDTMATSHGRAAASVPSAPKLTPMQAAMREKLISARFRHLNETLYTKPSAEAFQLFQSSPEMFQEYHEGFRRQVDVWPENPVDGYLEDIKLRTRYVPRQNSKQVQAVTAATSELGPLPRTNGVCTIADLGCGDAKLAEMLQGQKKKLKINMLSYDLQSPSPFVTRADIANLPLEDGSVNLVIFCLALMGTNWLDFIEEAYRVLHWKGELWIAEIKSRFGQVGKSKKGPVTHSVGNRKKMQGKKSKSKDEEADEDHHRELAVEVDGAEDQRQQTDVSDFVEALRRRGFLLQGPVDLRNKMFVKMHFLKAASPSVGKGAVALREPGRDASRKVGAKFTNDEDLDAVDESKILKPSVYKIR
ncbi:hypothetical protein GGR56DRAFT_631727 [Xylariaceae sp. FL0804]|nr:hypothetical protein GGR56DRAFT_631727 [Xylariaceae sp. FL0804]